MFAPLDSPSLLSQVVVVNKLSSLCFSYNSIQSFVDQLKLVYRLGHGGKYSDNSIANGFWTLGLQFSRLNETIQHEIPITFGPTGKIDFTRTSENDLNEANSLLTPIMSALGILAISKGIKLDFWELTGWMFVGGYWSILADVGQIQPTVYGRPPLDFPADFSLPVTHTSVNNIFINETLFYIHYDYMLEVVLPLLGVLEPTFKFAPPIGQNQLNETQTTFMRTYLCNIRRRKGTISALVSITVTDYAFVRGAYNLFIFAAAWYQRKKLRDCMSP